MAELYNSPDEDDYEMKESWLAWSIELMRRGLRPVDEITVHGPHPPSFNYMWGEAECETIQGGSIDVEFFTHRCSSIWDIRGVRVREKGYEYVEEAEYFTIIPHRKLPKEWRNNITALKREKNSLREKAKILHDESLQRQREVYNTT